MKKIIFLMMTMLVFTSCLTKVNVDNKGDLNLSIKWPESSDSKSVSKALLSGTDKVEIYLFHPATHTSINRTLTHADGQTHNEEFKDLPEGVWDININTYTGSTLNANYSDFITISNDNPTYVTHKFGSPNGVSYPLNGYYSPYDYIGDGGIISFASPYYIGIENKGCTYSVSSSYDLITGNTNYDTITARFIVSKDSKFEKDFVQFETIGANPTFENYYEITGQPYGAYIGAPVSLDVNLSPNTKYYWKVILTNSIGSTTSTTFSFTTGQP